MPSPTFGLAVVWTAPADPEPAARMLEGLAETFPIAEVPLLEVLLWRVGLTAGVTVHVQANFTLYGRQTLESLRTTVERSGGQVVELLRIAEDRREVFRTHYLAGSGTGPGTVNSWAEAARKVQGALVAQAAAQVMPTPAGGVPIVSSSSSASRRVRKEPRFNVSLETEFRTEGEFVREHATNISKGGLFIKTTQRPALNSEIGIRVRLPNGQTLEVLARVVHVAEGEHGGIGLTFVGDEGFQSALRLYLMSLVGPGPAKT